MRARFEGGPHHGVEADIEGTPELLTFTSEDHQHGDLLVRIADDPTVYRRVWVADGIAGYLYVEDSS